MDDDDEEEHFRDVASDDEQPSQIVPEVSSWDHKIMNKSHQNNTLTYDMFKRNPLYCGSDNACLHELLFLKNHAHPTVALFAQNLLAVNPFEVSLSFANALCFIQGKSVDYNGNPLIDFTSMRFFDRFIYKNPKKQIAKHGKSGTALPSHSRTAPSE
jgi:ribosome biogenesis protein MAK21